LNTCLFVRDFHGNDPRWVYYLLDSIDFSSFNSGSAQPSLNRNYLAQIPVALPLAGEQRAISAVLGAIDDKIESNRRALTIASELLDALSERWSVDLPRVRLADLATLNRNTIDPTVLGEELVHLFSLPAFDEGALPEVVRASEIRSNKTQISARAVLVSRLNPRIDRTWWVTPDPALPALASTEFACLNGAAGIDLAAVWLAVRDPAFRAEVIHRVTGTSGSHQRVRPDDFLAIEAMDVRGLQEEVTAQALALLSFVDQARIESRSLATVRNALLPELLSGRTRASLAEGIEIEVWD
jgi:type I restriction enzyme S subunit